MSGEIYARLAGIFSLIALGALLYRLPIWDQHRGARVQTPADDQNLTGQRQEAAAGATHAIAQMATLVLIPVLLFRTMVRLDLAAMPWQAIQGYFVPVTLGMLATVVLFKRRPVAAQARQEAAAAAPAARTTTAIYGNAVQLGIPLAAGLFGEAGLAIHLALVSLHSLIVLTCLTVIAESALVRAGRDRTDARQVSIWQAAGRTIGRSIWHPVVLPIVLGLLWNLLGMPYGKILDQILALLGAAALPMCLLLIGMTLAQYGWRAHARPALPQVVIKILVLPAVVFLTAKLGFGLHGVPLQVVVLMAALPVGTNALIFAQRYRLLQSEATTAIVISTAAFVMTAPMWLWALQRWA